MHLHRNFCFVGKLLCKKGPLDVQLVATEMPRTRQQELIIRCTRVIDGLARLRESAEGLLERVYVFHLRQGVCKTWYYCRQQANRNPLLLAYTQPQTADAPANDFPDMGHKRMVHPDKLLAIIAAPHTLLKRYCCTAMLDPMRLAKRPYLAFLPSYLHPFII